MQLFHSGKRQMFAFFVPGFLLGIIYVNVVAKEHMADIEIFSEYYLTHFSSGGIIVREYLPYLLRVRLIPLLFLAALAFTKLRKAAAVFFLAWSGFTGGIILSSAADELGIMGSFLCAVSVFPHFFFYVPAYLILLWYCCSAPRTVWNRQKTVFLVFAMAAGIILELYVNPSIVGAFLSLTYSAS